MTSVQKRMEPRRSLLGASVDVTDARKPAESGSGHLVRPGGVVEHVVDREAGSDLDADPIRSPPASERLDHFPGEAGSLLQRTSVGVGTAIRSRHLERIGKVPVERAATSGSREAGRTARRARRPPAAPASPGARRRRSVGSRRPSSGRRPRGRGGSGSHRPGRLARASR